MSISKMASQFNTLKNIMEESLHPNLAYNEEDYIEESVDEDFRRKAIIENIPTDELDDIRGVEKDYREEIAAIQSSTAKGLNQKNILFMGVGTVSFVTSAMFKKEPFSTIGMIVGAGVMGLGISDAIGLFKIPSF